MLAEIDRAGEDQILFTDPDGRAVAVHTALGSARPRGGTNPELPFPKGLQEFCTALRPAISAAQQNSAANVRCGVTVRRSGRPSPSLPWCHRLEAVIPLRANTGPG